MRPGARSRAIAESHDLEFGHGRKGRAFVGASTKIGAAGLVSALLFVTVHPVGQRSADLAQLPDVRAACDGDNPYLVTVCYPHAPSPRFDQPSVVLVRDTPTDRPHHLLAEQAQVGSVWGLAYSGGEHAVYAAAFHKRLVAFGPDGPGAIYRIDLATGDVSTFATVPDAGPDRHDRVLSGNARDRAGRDWAGKTSLGDLDIDAGEKTLFVSNLNDRRIHRFEIATGQWLGAFDHGAAGEDWAEDARPFGLMVVGGEVFHGVVRTAEQSRLRRDLEGRVFASRPDGSAMREVARFPLSGRRGQVTVPTMVCPGNPCHPTQMDLRWNPWRSGYQTKDPAGAWAVFPMPVVADLELTATGEILIGLRDRQGDMTMPPAANAPGELSGLGVGDLLRGEPRGDTWFVDPDAEHYQDSGKYSAQIVLGGLAIATRPQELVATALQEGEWGGLRPPPLGGLLWFDSSTGNKMRREDVCSGASRPRLQLSAGDGSLLDLPGGGGGPPRVQAHDEGTAPMHLGDVEEACAAPTDPATPFATTTPSPAPTHTPSPTVSPSPAATSSPSPTSFPPPSPTQRPAPAYLPLLLREHCDPRRSRVDVALVIDASTSMSEPAGVAGTKLDASLAAAGVLLDRLDLAAGDRAAIVSFNEVARVHAALTDDRGLLDDALTTIESRPQTRLDLAVEKGELVLVDPRRDADRAVVLVLLTDGRANPVPAEVAVEAARRAKSNGVRVVTVGLGSDLDEDALLAMASRDADYLRAPSAEDLAAVYARIALTLPCPPERFWGRRVR